MNFNKIVLTVTDRKSGEFMRNRFVLPRGHHYMDELKEICRAYPGRRFLAEVRENGTVTKLLHCPESLYIGDES